MNNSVTQKIIIGCLISLCSFSLGFGYSQMRVANMVTSHQTEISHLKDTNVQIRKEISDERTRTDQRIGQVASLMSEVIRQNQEFITLLRVQNQILERKLP